MLILFKKTRLYKGTFNAAAQEEQAAVTQMVLAIVVHPFSDLMMNKSKTVEGKGRKSGGGGGVKIKKKKHTYSSSLFCCKIHIIPSHP